MEWERQSFFDPFPDLRLKEFAALCFGFSQTVAKKKEEEHQRCVLKSEHDLFFWGRSQRFKFMNELTIMIFHLFSRLFTVQI